MRKAILMMLLAVVSTSAAAVWVEVGSNKEVVIYADPTTMDEEGDMVKMWDLFDFKSSQVTILGKQFISQMSQHEYDCKEKRARMLYFSRHSANMAEGEEIYRDIRLGNWESVPPGVPIELLWKIACGRQK